MPRWDPNRNTVCSVDGCNRKTNANGLCGMHYMRMKRTGSVDDPNGTKPGEAIEFIRNAIATHTDDCIIWPYCLHTFGYAQANILGKTTRVHNYVCRQVYGKAPPKHEAAHSCGIRSCINHRHLSWKTRVDNQADRVLHGTTNRGERQWNAILTKTNVIKIRTELHLGVSQSDLARRYGVNKKTINDIALRKTWAWLD